jgi:plastocyanin
MKEIITGPFAVQPASVFHRFMVGSLLAGAVFCSIIKLIVGASGGPPLPVTVSMLTAALVLAMNLRWSPLLGAILMIGYLVAFAFQPFVPYHLTQPKIQFETFLAILLLIVVLGIGLVASLASLAQHMRQQVGPTPAWFRSLLLAAGAFVAGAVLIASIAQSAGASNENTQTTYTNGVPTVHMNIDSFEQPSVTLSKGSKLLLVDDGSYNHVLFNGTWQNGQPQPESVPGAPIVNNLDVNGNRATIGPFTTAGTYHLYCSIHSDMMLTIIVQ